MVDFATLLREADVLSIHIHLTDENRGLIDREALAAMKKTAVLLNTSRGAVIDQDALLEALETGRLAGAGLDVIEGEWDDNLHEHPLIRYARTNQNLVISPHIGGVTYESQKMTLEYTVLKLRSYLEYARKGLMIYP